MKFITEMTISLIASNDLMTLEIALLFAENRLANVRRILWWIALPRTFESQSLQRDN